MSLELTPLELDLIELEEGGRRPRVVAIGGGHGLAAALTAVRSYAEDITAIVSVADDGGSSGRLTSRLGIPPPGDIRRCLLALTPDASAWSALFAYRFREDAYGDAEPLVDVSGHSLGNLIIAALADLAGGFTEGVSWAGTLLGIMGRVVPAADRPVILSGMVAGTEVVGQAALTRASGGINQLVVGPDGIHANTAALEAIAAADQIILGPGSLYTSVLAALLVPGIAEAIDSAPGTLVFVANLVTQDGETLGMSGADHLEALRQIGRIERVGTVVAHRGGVIAGAPLDPVTFDDAACMERGWFLTLAELAQEQAPRALHDPVKLARVLSDM